jgi:tetratricopeptide (TPR) repeat protein
MEVALATFGPGSRQHLRAAMALSQLRTMRQDHAAGQAVLAPVLHAARGRTDGVAHSVEFLSASIEDAVYLCAGGKSHEGIAALRGLRERVEAAHGPSSYLLEPILLGLGGCLADLGDPTAFGWFLDAYEVAATRERPPSTHLMQLALEVFNWAVSARDLVVGERYYQRALENSEAIADPEVRDRLTINVRSSRVCQLMQQGKADEAVRMATPIIAGHNATYARVGRLTPNQGGIWICYADALRQLGRYDEASDALNTFADRCRALKRFAPGAACEVRALTARALVELDAGRIVQARATMDERLRITPQAADDPRFPIAYARVTAGTERAGEAVAPLRDLYGMWLSTQPGTPFAAETLYWLGRASQAAGDPRGERMVAQSRRELAKSPVSYHRALASSPLR